MRRRAGGSVLVGGSPLRVLRITPEAVALLDALAAGRPIEGAASVTLARRLLDAGMAHPRPPVSLPARGAPAAPAPPAGPAPPAATHPDVGVAPPSSSSSSSSIAPLQAITAVVPVRDDAAGLDATLAGLAIPCVVVDDGSLDAAAVATVAGRRGARLFRRDAAGGPAAARNEGLEAVRTPLVLFLDAGVLISSPGIVALAAHLADPGVVAAAPRVLPVAAPGTPAWLAAYETSRSPLDMGAAEGMVAPRRRVAYVPTAAILARTTAVRAAGGFDPGLRHGEDVDLVWRLGRAGAVRYVPAVTAVHPMRPGLQAMLRQRFGYGTSSAPLERRHGTAVAPVRLSPWTAAAWGAAGARLPALAIAFGGVGVLGLRRRLRLVLPAPGQGADRHPRAQLAESTSEALRLAGLGQLRAGAMLGSALRRDWWPLALTAGIASRRLRPAIAVAVLVPPLAGWVRRRPALDPARWLLLWLADDLAYGTGVWRGCLAERSGRALLPELSRGAAGLGGLPGSAPASASASPPAPPSGPAPVP